MSKITRAQVLAAPATMYGEARGSQLLMVPAQKSEKLHSSGYRYSTIAIRNVRGITSLGRCDHLVFEYSDQRSVGFNLRRRVETHKGPSLNVEVLPDGMLSYWADGYVFAATGLGTSTLYVKVLPAT